MKSAGTLSALGVLLFGTLCWWSAELGLWSLKHARWAGVPLWLIGAAALLHATLGSFGSVDRLWRAFFGRISGVAGKLQFRSHWLWIAPISVLAFFVFMLLRQRLFLPPPEGLGDSLDLARRIPVFTELFGYLDSFDETLTLYFRSRAYALLKPFGASATDAGALWSSLWGALYVGLVLSFARTRRQGSRFYAGAFLLVTPAIQVFCGYIENYAEPMFFLCALLFAGGRLLADTEESDGLPYGQLVALAALAALAATFHLVLGALLPALAYVVWMRAGSRGTFVRQSAAAAVSAGMVLAAIWSYFLFVHPHPVNPLESHVRNPPVYPIREWFGAKHLFDQLNMWLLVAPLTLLLGPVAVRSARASLAAGGRSSAHVIFRRQLGFYLLATLGFMGAMFVVNPLLGFPADWDLLSFFWLPLSFLVLTCLEPPAEDGAAPERAPVAIAGALLAAAVLTSAWIGRNMTTSTESIRNLSDAAAQAEGFVREIRRDEDYPALPTTRQKQYAKTLLFAYRAHQELALAGTAEAHALDVRLKSAISAYRQISKAPESEYRSRLPAVWKELTSINLALAELQPKPRPRTN